MRSASRCSISRNAPPDELVAERAQDSHDRLQQDHDAKGLEAPHADGSRGIPLSLADRLDAGAVGLDEERTVLEGDSGHAAGEFRRIEAEHGQAEVDEIDLHEERRIAHEVDIADGHAADEPAPRHPRCEEQQAERQRERYGRGGDADSYQEPGEKLRELREQEEGDLCGVVHGPIAMCGAVRRRLSP